MPGPRLQNRIAVITGASSGLGRAIALAYANEGAKLVCSDLQPEPRKEIASEADQPPTHEVITSEGGEAIFVKCDVAQSKEIEALVEEAVNRFGRVDIMVNNAGIQRQNGPAHDLQEESFDAVMNVNARGTFLGIKYAARQMLKQEPLNANGDRGWIINVGSIYSVVSVSGSLTYSTSKHAVAGITKSAALDYAKHGIHVNALGPMWADTALTTEILNGHNLKDGLITACPMGRLLTANDVTGPAIFLASDESSFITGHMLMVDGGFSVK